MAKLLGVRCLSYRPSVYGVEHTKVQRNRPVNGRNGLVTSARAPATKPSRQTSGKPSREKEYLTVLHHTARSLKREAMK